MAVLEGLLALQLIDTEIAQIEHRASHLPEAAEVRSIEANLARLESERRALNDELHAITASVEKNEAAVADVRRQIERLNGQLRTVIAPREAEALQHEIATLGSKASTLDDESLAAIERSESLEVEVRQLDASLNEVGATLVVSRQALASASEATRADLVDATMRRDVLVGTLDAAWVGRYDKKRKDLAGVAIARLVRSTCGGCHLDLSPSEVDAVKRQTDDERECPNCTRWLVV